jgi:hypothetical protein
MANGSALLADVQFMPARFCRHPSSLSRMIPTGAQFCPDGQLKHPPARDYGAKYGWINYVSEAAL